MSRLNGLIRALVKPPGDGEPEDAAAPSHPLTVLRPQMSSAIQIDRILTARPTLVVYLPATEARELQVRLYARDAEADYDYSTTVKLTASDSTIRIPLLASFPNLELGRNLHLGCRGDVRPRRPRSLKPNGAGRFRVPHAAR